MKIGVIGMQKKKKAILSDEFYRNLIERLRRLEKQDN